MPTLVAEGESHLFCWEVTLSSQAPPALHAHPFHELFLCLTGRGEQWSELSHYAMTPGDLYFFPAEQAHVARAATEGSCVGIVLYLAEEYFSPLRAGEAELARICAALAARARAGENLTMLSTDGQTQMVHLLTRLAEEFRRKELGYRCAAQTLLHETLLTMLRDPCAPKEVVKACQPDTRQPRLGDVMLFLHAHFMSPISVEQVLDLAHMSRSQFHAVFKAETGETLTGYLHRLRLDAAAALLRETSLPVTQIAGQCGFTCLSHFYHLFRARYRVSPRALRQQM